MSQRANSHIRIVLIAICGFIEIGIGNRAWAHGPSSRAPQGVLAEVVVTAKRHRTNLQTTSVSATVLSGKELQAKGVTNLTSLQYAAPALNITQDGSANVFTIRGLGRSQVDIDVPSGVVIYEDGAPMIAGYFQNQPYYDLASIQVLRGPQGTLVGKDAAGGAVFITTNPPRLGVLNGSIEAGVANYSAGTLKLIGNIPIGRKFAIRVDYRRHIRNDYFYKSITGHYTGHPGTEKENSYRLSALWKPSHNLRSLLTVDYEDLNFGGTPTSVYGQPPLGTLVQNANFVYTARSLRTVLNVKYRFADGIHLRSVSGYQNLREVNNLDLNATLPAPDIFDSKILSRILSQEVDLISPGNQPFTWVLGMFWDEQRNVLPPWQQGGLNFIGSGYPTTYPWATSPWISIDLDRAGFAHAAYRFTKHLQFELGARFTNYYHSQFTKWTLGDGASPPTIPWPGTPANGLFQSLTENSVDWQAAINWTVNRNQYIYGLVSKGHVTGGINIFPPNLKYYPMKVINYETGWKAQWAGDRLRTQFTLYYDTFNNYEANFATTLVGLDFPTNRNAATTSHVYGTELSAQAVFGAAKINFGFAYSKSALGNFDNVINPFLTPPNNVVNLTGASIPYAPKLTANIGVQYLISLGDNLTLTPRIDYSHVSKTQAALWSTPLETLPEKNLVNAQLVLAPFSSKWSATLWTTNLTNQHYVGGIQNNGTLYYAAPPRQYGLKVKYKF